MPRTLSPEATAALRAQLGFLRDLGIYDLYRREGRVATALIQEAASEILEPAPALATLPSSPPAPAGLKATLAATADAIPEPVIQARERTAGKPIAFPEDNEIAARKRAQPALLPMLLELSGTPLPAEARAAALRAIRAEIGDCTRCPLAFAGRHTIVFGDGDPNARILFVGEGPGADEDAQGIPFIGKAGQLLNNMITAMGLKREEVYIANIVKCRPPANRVPEPVEANTCTPFLLQQIGVVRPEIIVALGSTAATYLLGAKSPLSALRGRIHPVFGSKLIVTYHPAFLLRDPRQKKEAWADLQIAMRELAAPTS